MKKVKVEKEDSKLTKWAKQAAGRVVNAITPPKTNNKAVSEQIPDRPLTNFSSSVKPDVEAEARVIAERIAAEQALQAKKLEEAKAAADAAKLKAEQELETTNAAKLKAEQEQAAAELKTKAEAIEAARLALEAQAEAQLNAFAVEQAQRVKTLEHVLDMNAQAAEVKQSQLAYLSLHLEDNALALKDTLITAQAKFKADAIIRKERIRTGLFAAGFGFVAFCLVLGFAPVILPALGAALGVALVGAAGIGIAIGLATVAAAVSGCVGALLGKFVNYLSRSKAADKAEVAPVAGSTAGIIASVGGTGVAPDVKPAHASAPCNDQAEFVTPPSPRASSAPTPTM